MEFGKIALRYVLTFSAFIIIDLVWLGFIAKGIYQKWLGHLMADEVNWTAAIIFYLIFIAGLSIFVIYPAVHKDSISHAIIYGALLGVLTYSTYDLTNLATLKGWPWQLVLIDIVWGAVLSASVCAAGFYINSWIKS